MRFAAKIIAVLMGLLALALLLRQTGSFSAPSEEAPSGQGRAQESPSPPPVTESQEASTSSSTVQPGEREAAEIVRYAVRGLVIDLASREALPGVRLRLAILDQEETPAFERTTDAAGAFQFDGLEPRTYRLKTHPTEQIEYASEPLELDLAEEPTHDLELSVEKRWFLAGVVVEAGTLLPVADLALSARQIGKKRVWLGSTDEDGRFRSKQGCAAGMWRIHQASGTEGFERVMGQGPELLQVQVGTLDVTRLRIELPWNGRLCGTVTDQSDRPIEGAVVRALAADQLSLRSQELRFWALYEGLATEGVIDTSDAFGRFELPHLPNDRNLLVVTSAKGYVTAPCRTLHPPFTADGETLRIRLLAGGAIHGQGAGYENLLDQVGVASSKGVEYQPDPTRSAESGRFALEELAPGEYLVLAMLRNREMRTPTVASRTVVVTAGQTAEIVLQKGAADRPRVAGLDGNESDPQRGSSHGTRITGRILDEDGRPVTSEREPALIVRCRNQNPPPGVVNLADEIPAEADGSFAIEGLEPGTYQLYVLTYVAGDPYDPIEVTAPAADVILKWTPSSKIRIVVKILDAASGQPVQSGSVALQSSSAGTLSGNFFGGSTQYDAREGLFEVFVSASGLAPEVRSLDLTGYTAAECVIEFRLREGRRVTGLVQSAAGDPVKGAAVVPMLNGHWATEGVVYSGADGRFETDSAPWTDGQIGVLSSKWRQLARADITDGDVILVLSE